MYITTLDQNDLTWLAFAAGIAAGSGNEAAHTALFGIISRIQDVPSEHEVAFSPALEEVPEYEEVEGEDFGGTIDPNFAPVVPLPPSRPSNEFGPGPVRGGLG